MAWMPRSGRDTFDELVWLPRIVDKARRYIALGERSRLFDGYCYGGNDFIDSKVLHFLRMDDDALTQIVRERPDDADAMRTVLERSGRTREERRAFSAKLKRSLFNFVLTEADEGRIPPGFRRTCVNALYHGLIMPLAYAMFRRDEGRR